MVQEIAKLLLAPAKRFLAIAKRHFGSFALDELTDLATDGSQHIEQLLIGLPDLTAEKLDHAQGFPADEDGKGQGRV